MAPNTPLNREVTKDEAPLSNKKMRDMLGFEDTPEWVWTEELKRGGVDFGSLKKTLLENLQKEGVDVKGLGL